MSVVLGDPRSPSGIEQFPAQSGRYFLWLGVCFLAQFLEVSQKILPLYVLIRSCVPSPYEFQIWPAHTIFPTLPAALFLSVARLSFYVPETASHGQC